MVLYRVGRRGISLEVLSSLEPLTGFTDIFLQQVKPSPGVMVVWNSKNVQNRDSSNNKIPIKERHGTGRTLVLN